MRPLGLQGSVRRIFRFYPEVPLTLPGTGGSRVQRHILLFRSMREYGSNGTDAAAPVVKGMADAGKAKGVFYDNQSQLKRDVCRQVS